MLVEAVRCWLLLAGVGLVGQKQILHLAPKNTNFTHLQWNLI